MGLDTDHSDTANQKPGLMFALIFAGMGAAMMVVMAISPEGLHVPLWVAEIAAATFVFAGISIAGQALMNTWLTRLGSLGVVYGLCVPGLWIMLDPSPKSCTANIMFLTSNAVDWSCRAVFGIGGIITVLCAIAMTVSVIRQLR